MTRSNGHNKRLAKKRVQYLNKGQVPIFRPKFNPIIIFDSIMNPPYDITPTILKLVRSVSEKIGEVNANYLQKPSLQLIK